MSIKFKNIKNQNKNLLLMLFTLFSLNNLMFGVEINQLIKNNEFQLIENLNAKDEILDLNTFKKDNEEIINQFKIEIIKRSIKTDDKNILLDTIKILTNEYINLLNELKLKYVENITLIKKKEDEIKKDNPFSKDKSRESGGKYDTMNTKAIRMFDNKIKINKEKIDKLKQRLKKN